MSGIRTAVPLQPIFFTVSLDGDYDFLAVSLAPVNWDTYLFLYQIDFDPSDQFTNANIGNDDLGGIGQSVFNQVSLVSGTEYIAVASGFGNADLGTYELTTTGPGVVTIIPEPSAAVLLLSSLVGVCCRRRC